MNKAELIKLLKNKRLLLARDSYRLAFSDAINIIEAQLEGHEIVPVEPTEEMINAGMRYKYKQAANIFTDNEALDSKVILKGEYQAMLSATTEGDR